MKKVLMVFDNTNFSEGAFEFARWLNQREPVLVTAAFVPQVDFANLWSYTAGVAGAMVIPMLEETDAELVQKNIERFEELCKRNKMTFAVHRDFYGFVVPELQKESRFSDLMILGGENFYLNLGAGVDDSMKETLHASECPVVVVPERYELPQAVVLAYDGGASSLHAMKQFSFLFSQLTALPTLLVYWAGKDQPIPAKENIEEWARCHFKNLELLKLDKNSQPYFNTWLKARPGAMLVSGAFGRSQLSQMFRKSFVAPVIEEHRVPLFIAHK